MKEEKVSMTERKIFNRLGLILALDMVLWVGGQLLAAFLLDTFIPHAMDREWVFWLVTMGPQYLVAFPVTFKLCQHLPRRELYRHKMGKGQLVQVYAMAVFVSMIGNVIGMIITSVLTGVTNFDFTVDSTDIILEHGLDWVFLVSVIIGPIIEEVLYRKLLMDRLVVFGDVTAILVSAIFFGFAHGNFSQFFYAFGLGLIFGFVYVRTGKLRYTIGLHMVFNFFGGFIPVAFAKKMSVTGLMDALDHIDFGVIFNHLGVVLGFVAFELAVFCVGIVGLVLLIINRKNFKVNRGEVQLSKGEVAKQFFTTPGMWLWIVATVVLFALNVAGV